jgi:hypothetical protein
MPKAAQIGYGHIVIFPFCKIGVNYNLYIVLSIKPSVGIESHNLNLC